MNETQGIKPLQFIRQLLGRLMRVTDKIGELIEESVDSTKPYVETVGIYGTGLKQEAILDAELDRIEAAARYKERKIEINHKINKLSQQPQDIEEAQVIEQKSIDQEVEELLQLTS
jgi:hypothetical protein